MKPIEMKVKSDSLPKSVAGAIASTFRDLKDKGVDLSQQRILISSIGAGALNQAVKAFIIAKQFLAASNITLSLDAGFKDLNIESQERTAIELVIAARIV